MLLLLLPLLLLLLLLLVSLLLLLLLLLVLREGVTGVEELVGLRWSAVVTLVLYIRERAGRVFVRRPLEIASVVAVLLKVNSSLPNRVLSSRIFSS